jgi:hypothetical protein
MTSLLDIGPLKREIPLGDKSVSVQGISPEGFFYLLAKFPLLQNIFTSGSKNLDMATLQTVAPDCISFVLATACTDRSEFATLREWTEAIEKGARIVISFSAHHQVLLFQAALDLTFPDGVGPFMAAVESLGTSVRRANGQTAPATTSSKRSRSGFSKDSPGLRLGRAAPSASSRH